jgi:hypothetical protein
MPTNAYGGEPRTRTEDRVSGDTLAGCVPCLLACSPNGGVSRIRTVRSPKAARSTGEPSALLV